MAETAHKMNLQAQPTTNSTELIDLAFQNISYSVKVPLQDQEAGGNKKCCHKEMQDKHILRGISGIAKGGEVTAIMGASGAGKTTLLNIISCRIPMNKGQKHQEGHANGKLFSNRQEYDYEKFGDFANYVMQEDILLQSLTVRQTLEYVGGLTLNQPQIERKHKIEEIVKNLKLQKCIDTLVGGSLLKGISGGERKRTSIAFQLMSEPQVVVLDQPTSGLDSLTAYIICTYLHRLATTQNKTIIMTIHQPNSEIFNLFDRLLFLIEGKCVYQGPASQTVDYFNRIGFTCPQFSNPPDYIMSIMHHQSKTNVQNYPLYLETYQKQQKALVDDEINRRRQGPVIQRKSEKPPLCQRLNALLRRDFLNTTRNPLIVKARFIQSIIMGLLVGGVYFGIQKDYFDEDSQLASVNFKTLMGVLFFLSMVAFMSSLSPVSIVFPKERLVFLKEQGSRLYGTGLFFLSRNIVQMPYLVLIPLVMQLIFYWMVGFGGTVGSFFTFYFIFFLLSLSGSSLGLLLGSMIADAKVVSLLVPVMILPFVLFSGFSKNREDLPVWLFWLEYISPLKYSFISFLHNQLDGTEDEFLLSEGFLNLQQALSLWASIFTLLGLALFFRLLSLVFLWAKRTRLQ